MKKEDEMDPKTVRKLEKLEDAIAGVICDMGLRKLPLTNRWTDEVSYN
jgi:hypothetical protein